MTVLVFVELTDGRVSLVSREALTFALEIGGDLHAVPLGPVGEDALADLRAHGVAVVHEASAPELSSYGGAIWGAVLDAAVTASGATAVVAPGTPRGTEVLAHLAARRDRAMAANAIAVLAVSQSRSSARSPGARSWRPCLSMPTSPCSPWPGTRSSRRRLRHRAPPRCSHLMSRSPRLTCALG